MKLNPYDRAPHSRVTGILLLLGFTGLLYALMMPYALPAPVELPTRHYVFSTGLSGSRKQIIDTGGAYSLTITDADQTVYMTFPAGTVADALERAGITVHEYDTVEPPLDTALTEGQGIIVTRIEPSRETFYSDIPYETVTVENEWLVSGATNTLQEGVTGIRREVYDIVRYNGEVRERTLVESVVEKEPTEEIVEAGVFVPPVVDAENKTLTLWDGTVVDYKYYIDVEATAYTCEGQEWNITKTGTIARVGEIAVDPRYIPLNSKLYVVARDGTWVYGLCKAEDTGGLIKGYRIDLYYDTEHECWQFGRRNARVYVLPDDYVIDN